MSTDDEKRQFKEKKHLNLHGFGDDYLRLIQRRYADKDPNQYSLKEKAAYLQVQNNEMAQKMFAQDEFS